MTMTLEVLDKYIGDFIIGRSSLTFDQLALAIHAYQYHNNSFYRETCIAQRISEQITDFDLIPSFAIESFKGGVVPSVDVLPLMEGMWFETSGTSVGQKTRIFRDRGYFDLRTMSIKVQGEENWFRRFGGKKIKIIFIDKANRRDQKDFKFQYSVLNNMAQYFGSEESFFCDHENDFFRIMDSLNEAAKNHNPLAIVGPSYFFSDLLERIRKSHISIPYNDQLLIMDSGGLKGKGCHASMQDYHSDLFATFKLQSYNYKNTYAMTETGVQISDDDYGWKEVPRWAKIILMDHDGRRNASRGKIVIYDLLNRANLFSIITNDIARFDHGRLIIEGRHYENH